MEKIFNNFGLKIAALFLALLLWFHATTDKSFVYHFNLPLVLSGLSSDLILATQLPSEAKVKIKGKGKQLIKYFLSDKESIVIDVSKFRAREVNYVIKPEEVPLPKDLSLEVAEVDSPKQMKIRLDYLSKKEVPVKPQIEVMPQSGYVQVGTLELKPDRVLLSGPRGLIRKVDWVDTEKRILGSLNSSASGLVPLVMPEGFNLKLSPDKVEYSIKIEKIVQREFPQLSVETMNLSPKRKIRIEPESVSVIIQGASQQIDSLDPDKIKIGLDFNKIGKEKQGKTVPKVQLPEGVELLKIEPDSVKFTLE